MGFIDIFHKSSIYNFTLDQIYVTFILGALAKKKLLYRDSKVIGNFAEI